MQNYNSKSKVPVGFKVLAFVTFTFLLFTFNLSSAYAAISTPSGNLETSVSATVGEFYLTVSGFISPFASVVLASLQDTFLQSVVADGTGNFSFERIPIEPGFAGFCLTAVDFKQLGESKTCFSFPPATDSVVMTDIFLAPTLGLSKTEIGVGSTAFAFGYTMPGAVVSIYINAIQFITATADSAGYYEVELKDLPVGQHEVYSRAQLQAKESVKPTKSAQIKVLSIGETATGTIGNLLDRAVGLITTLWFVPLLIAIPLIILIIILILKLRPRSMQFKLKKEKKKLHHWWFVGF